MGFVWLCPICERGQGHVFDPLPAQQVLLFQQPPQQGHTVRIIPDLTLKLFEIQNPCQRRKDGRCSAPGNCLEVHQEGPTCSAGDAPTEPVTVGQMHSSGGVWIPGAISLCSTALACWGYHWGCQPGRNPSLCNICVGGSGAWYSMPGICVPSPILHIFSQELQDWRTCLHIPCSVRTSRLPHSKVKAVPHTPNAIICYLHGWKPCAAAHPCSTGDM